jgi:hypothetical protein
VRFRTVAKMGQHRRNASPKTLICGTNCLKGGQVSQTLQQLMKETDRHQEALKPHPDHTEACSGSRIPACARELQDFMEAEQWQRYRGGGGGGMLGGKKLAPMTATPEDLAI